jgi:hypothetical protein
MDVTPTSGPMTRARARAIDTEVNSLLSQIPLNTSETWMLPQVETLCVIRYQDEEDGAATSDGQEDMELRGMRNPAQAVVPLGERYYRSNAPREVPAAQPAEESPCGSTARGRNYRLPA